MQNTKFYPATEHPFSRVCAKKYITTITKHSLPQRGRGTVEHGGGGEPESGSKVSATELHNPNFKIIKCNISIIAIFLPTLSHYPYSYIPALLIPHKWAPFSAGEGYRYALYRCFLHPLAYTRGGAFLLDGKRGAHIKPKIPPRLYKFRHRSDTSP